MRTLVRHAAPLVLAACSACNSPGSKPAEPARAAPAQQPLAAARALYPVPAKPFSAPQPWSPPRGGAPVAPPQVSELTWYVQVDQYDPHQKPTPEWQPLPPTETVEIKMPAGSSFRCIAPPLEIQPQPEESGSALESWTVSRDVLCTADGFKTFSAHPYRMHILPNGQREPDYGSEGWLREHAADGSIIHTVFSVSAEAPRREATVGPPRILTRSH